IRAPTGSMATGHNESEGSDDGRPLWAGIGVVIHRAGDRSRARRLDQDPPARPARVLSGRPVRGTQRLLGERGKARQCDVRASDAPAEAENALAEGPVAADQSLLREAIRPAPPGRLRGRFSEAGPLVP